MITLIAMIGDQTYEVESKKNGPALPLGQD